MSNIVGIDLDYYNRKSVSDLKRDIILNEKQNGLIQVIVFKTKHGYHMELVYGREILPDENFKIRKKYMDCKNRIEYSKKRYKVNGVYDILFHTKNRFERKRIWL